MRKVIALPLTTILPVITMLDMRPLKEPNYNRYYKNKYERAFADLAKSNGWLITKCGYPDFICYKDGEVMLVEVKPSQKHRLKGSQHKFMNAMKAYGLKCYKWYPSGSWMNGK